MKIGEESLPTDGLGDYSTSTRTVMVALTDLVQHPDSTVGEIASRTGLAQSAVSGAIARLREAGAVETVTDPGDRRRALIRQSSSASERAATVAASSIESALAAAMPDTDAATVAAVHTALETAAARLLPSWAPRQARDLPGEAH